MTGSSYFLERKDISCINKKIVKVQIFFFQEDT